MHSTHVGVCKTVTSQNAGLPSLRLVLGRSPGYSTLGLDSANTSGLIWAAVCTRRRPLASRSAPCLLSVESPSSRSPVSLSNDAVSDEGWENGSDKGKIAVAKSGACIVVRVSSVAASA